VASTARSKVARAVLHRHDGIVVIGLPVDATINMIRILVSDFLGYAELIAHLHGKLIIVEPGRIRVRE